MNKKYIVVLLLSIFFISLIALTATAAPPPTTTAASGIAGKLSGLFDMFYEGFGWTTKIANTISSLDPRTANLSEPEAAETIFWMRIGMILILFSFLMLGAKTAFGDKHKGLGLAVFLIALLSVFAIPPGLLITIIKTYAAIVVFLAIAAVVVPLMIFRHLLSQQEENHPTFYRAGKLLLTFVVITLVAAFHQGVQAFDPSLGTLTDIGDTYNWIVLVLFILLFYDIFKFISSFGRGALAREGLSVDRGVSGWARGGIAAVKHLWPGGDDEDDAGDTGGGGPHPGRPGGPALGPLAGGQQAEQAQEQAQEGQQAAERATRAAADIQRIARREQDTEGRAARIEARPEQQRQELEVRRQQREANARRLAAYNRQLRGFHAFARQVIQHWPTADVAQRQQLRERYAEYARRAQQLQQEITRLISNPEGFIEGELGDLQDILRELEDFQKLEISYFKKERVLARKEEAQAHHLKEVAEKMGLPEVKQLAENVQRVSGDIRQLAGYEQQVAQHIVDDLAAYEDDVGQLEHLQDNLRTHLDAFRKGWQEYGQKRTPQEREQGLDTLRMLCVKIIELFNTETTLSKHMEVLDKDLRATLTQERTTAQKLRRMENYAIHAIDLARAKMTQAEQAIEVQRRRRRQKKSKGKSR